MTKESTLWNRFRDCIGVRAKVTRIENAIGKGTPDVHGVSNGHSWWIELKVAERPKRPTSRVRVEHFTTEQRQWLVEHCGHGGLGFVLIQVTDVLYLLNGVQAAIFLDKVNEDAIRLRSLIYGKDINKIVDWVLTLA